MSAARSVDAGGTHLPSSVWTHPFFSRIQPGMKRSLLICRRNVGGFFPPLQQYLIWSLSQRRNMNGQQGTAIMAGMMIQMQLIAKQVMHLFIGASTGFAMLADSRCPHGVRSHLSRQLIFSACRRSSSSYFLHSTSKIGTLRGGTVPHGIYTKRNVLCSGGARLGPARSGGGG